MFLSDVINMTEYWSPSYYLQIEKIPYKNNMDSFLRLPGEITGKIFSIPLSRINFWMLLKSCFTYIIHAYIVIIPKKFQIKVLLLMMYILICSWSVDMETKWYSSIVNYAYIQLCHSMCVVVYVFEISNVIVNNLYWML